MKRSYGTKDISIVIPTYNRPKDLQNTLQSLKFISKSIREIIVVDQSKNSDTKRLIKSIKIKNLKYIFSNIPSITKARNLGVKYTYSKSRIICFLDDDVTLDKSYFEEIIKIFNSHENAKAVAGYTQTKRENKVSPFENLLRKLFFLGHLEKGKARIIGAYGNTYPSSLSRVINVQWLPGVNMAYKKEVFKEQQFDENLIGYTVAEDIDFSYRLYKKYPFSLYLTPKARLVHRVSMVERVPTERMSYINQVDHFYFFFKNFESSYINNLKFIWSLYGITLLRTVQYFTSFKNKDLLKLRFFISSLWYCCTHILKIKKGKVREF